jgi:hypothetical protein
MVSRLALTMMLAATAVFRAFSDRIVNKISKANANNCPEEGSDWVLNALSPC